MIKPTRTELFQKKLEIDLLRTAAPYLKAMAKEKCELPMGFISSLYQALNQRLRSTPFGGWLRNFEHYDIGFDLKWDETIMVDILFLRPPPQEGRGPKITPEHRQQIAGLANQLLKRVLRLIAEKAKEFQVEKLLVALRYEDHFVRVYRFRVEQFENKKRR